MSCLYTLRTLRLFFKSKEKSGYIHNLLTLYIIKFSIKRNFSLSVNSSNTHSVNLRLASNVNPGKV